MEKNNERFDYLDCLRGFAMLLVVFAHVWFYVFGYNDNRISVLQILDVFMLPLFFFISGYLSKLVFLRSSLWYRVVYMLVPTIVMFILYEIAGGKTCQQMVCDYYTEYKGGYWFPFALFIMNMIHAIISNSVPSGIVKKKLVIILLLIVVVNCIIVLKDWDWNFNNAFLAKLISLRLLAQFFPLYVAGVICMSYRFFFFDLLKKEWIRGFSLISIVALLTFPFGGFYKFELLAFLGVYIAFGYVHDHQRFFSQVSFCGRQLSQIGRYTLPIYLIHYFIMIGLQFKCVNDLFNPSCQWGVISLIAIAFTIVIVYVSLAIRSLISMSTPLYRLLLGK